jgi:outer membrane protein TolC
LSSGLNLSIPIFNGGQQKTKIKNARLQLSNQNHILEQEKLNIEKQVRLLWQNYQNQLQNIMVEESNLEASEMNLFVSREMLKNAQITNTQFREAQQNLLQAKTNISNARFTAKQLEYQMLKISGRLFKIEGERHF